MELLSRIKDELKGVCFSIAWAGVCAAAFALMCLFPTHIVTASPEGQGGVIYAPATGNIFTPFSWMDIPAFLVFLFCALVVLVALSLLCEHLHSGEASRFKMGYMQGTVLFVLLLICWSPYLLSWLPGGTYSDTNAVIMQALGNIPLSNRHTVLYVLLWRFGFWLAGLAGQGEFAGALVMLGVQAVSMAAFATYCVRWLAGHGIGKRGCVLVAAFFALCPLVPHYVVAQWKDTIFSISLAYFALCFIDAAMLKGKPAILAARVCAGALLVAFTRNNGVYIALLALAVLVLIHRRRIKAVAPCLIVPLAACMALTWAIQGPVYSILGWNVDSTVESLGVPLQQVARTLAFDGDMSVEAREYFNSILPGETWNEAYRPFIVDSIKWNGSFNTERLDHTRGEFLRCYLETGFRNPLRYLEAFLMSNSGFWDPAVGWAENVAYVNTEISPANPPSYWQVDAIEALTGISLRDALEPKVFVSPAVFVWIMLASTSVLLVRRRYVLAAALAPAWGLWLTLLVATPLAYSLRYCFALVLLIPVFMAVQFGDFSEPGETMPSSAGTPAG